jgi:hypothetical protein
LPASPLSFVKSLTGDKALLSTIKAGRGSLKLSVKAHPWSCEKKPNAMTKLSHTVRPLFAHGKCQAETALFFHIKTFADHGQKPSESIIVG